ncbi:MAG: PmoA family protein, partial [Cytophagales bacterium]|nr:PmoA family protein [Cytophagales bacterium]
MKPIIFLFTLGMTLAGFAQQKDTILLKITVESGKYTRNNTPVSVATEAVLPDATEMAFYEKIGKTRKPVDFQLEKGRVSVLTFVLDGVTAAGKKRQYVLIKEKRGQSATPAVEVARQAGSLVLKQGLRHVLQYNHAVADVPPGVDSLYRRSGYIHPLWSPSGEVLTRIQPPDHYHHYGIWNPWTKTEVEGKEVDFWNLYKGQGKVKFVGYEGFETGPVFAGFRALQQHVVFNPDRSEKTAMNEVWRVKTYIHPNVALIDFVSELNNALPTDIVLKAYTYGGGIGFRATEKWHADNCELLTSEGKTRADANGSKARWCMVSGESDVKEKRSGLLFLCHPTNREYPQPLRIWGADFNKGRENMFVNFTPTQYKDWTLKPGQTYAQTYRLVA